MPSTILSIWLTGFISHYNVIQELISLHNLLFRLFGRTFPRLRYSIIAKWLGSYPADGLLSLQFTWTVRNIISSLTSLKANLRTNLYTKKQIIQQKSKSQNEPNYWILDDCPAMSKYVRRCPKVMAEFLTFRHEDFFATRGGAFASLEKFVTNISRCWQIRDNFRIFISASRGFQPADLLKKELIPRQRAITGLRHAVVPFSYYTECPHRHSKVSFRGPKRFRGTGSPHETTLLCEAVLQSRTSHVKACGCQRLRDAPPLLIHFL